MFSPSCATEEGASDTLLPLPFEDISHVRARGKDARPYPDRLPATVGCVIHLMNDNTSWIPLHDSLPATATAPESAPDYSLSQWFESLEHVSPRLPACIRGVHTVLNRVSPRTSVGTIDDQIWTFNILTVRLTSTGNTVLAFVNRIFLNRLREMR